MTKQAQLGSVFQRWFLPGFAFKAVVIGGGYATGRELAEYFLPSGAWGGILGILVSMLLWSIICSLTFLFARQTSSQDYGTFFAELLGPASFLFDIAYLCLVIVMLSVFGAASGAIGNALFGWPTLIGVLMLVVGIAVVSAYGNESVERLFKYVTIFLYCVYVVFFVLSLATFSKQIGAGIFSSSVNQGWAQGAITYTGYNIFGAVVILPVLRHLTSNRDAIIAGLLCGPLGMLPALMFFICMAAFMPQIEASALPSDYMLQQLKIPTFHVLFQVMIFAALLESGTGAVHAVNERVAKRYRVRGNTMSSGARFIVSSTILVLSIFFAAKFGLVALIAHGYRFLSYVFILVYVVPLLTYGSWRIVRNVHLGVKSEWQQS